MTTERKQATGDGERGAGTGKVRTPGAPTEDAASRTRARARSSQAYLDVYGDVNILIPRPPARTCAREDAPHVATATPPPESKSERLECSWREACKAADYVLEHFGDRDRDRGIWVWYCRRIGLETFLDIADEVISCTRQGEIKWPTKAFQRHLQDAFPRKGGAR